MIRVCSTWFIAALSLTIATTTPAQSVSNPKASYIDIPQRRAQLAKNKDPRTAKAIASLNSCT